MVKLSVIFVLIVCQLTQSAPIDSSTVLKDFEDIDTENYDIIIDQSQNGTQNFRIKVSGLSVAIPDDRNEPSNQSTSLDELESLLNPNSASGSTLNDYSELSALFDLLKKNNKRKSSETQSRTKDIPTDIQLSDNPGIKIKEIVQDQQRKYKVLVGEKYIVPILRYLKKQTEDVKD